MPLAVEADFTNNKTDFVFNLQIFERLNKFHKLIVPYLSRNYSDPPTVRYKGNNNQAVHAEGRTNKCEPQNHVSY